MLFNPAEEKIVAAMRKANQEGELSFDCKVESAAIVLRAKCYALAKAVRVEAEKTKDATMMKLSSEIGNITMSVKKGEHILKMTRKDQTELMRILDLPVADLEKYGPTAEALRESESRVLADLKLRRATDLPQTGEAEDAQQATGVSKYYTRDPNRTYEDGDDKPK